VVGEGADHCTRGRVRSPIRDFAAVTVFLDWLYPGTAEMTKP
jgi:hypothetical protein